MTAFSEALKGWRTTRRFSQLALALEADVSARHISFLETGRARPSAEMIARLAEALSLPMDAQNHLLFHAGFAPRFPGRQWDDAEMAPVRAALDHMLTSHDPYPALAIDGLWTIRQLNPAAGRLFAALGVGTGDSLLDVMCDPATPAMVENWPEVAAHAALRLRTESAARGGHPRLDQAAAFLADQSAEIDPSRTAPVVPTVFRLGDLRLSLFATIAQIGTPADLTLEDLKVELYFPSNDATARILRQMGN